MILEILFNFYLNIGCKQGGFFETLLKKNLKLLLNKRDDTIAFNLSLILLLAKVDFISKKQGCKRDALVTYGIGHVKIIFALSTKVIILYMWASIIEVRNPALKEAITEYRIYL